MTRVRPRAAFLAAVAILALLAGCSSSPSSAAPASSGGPAGSFTPLDPAAATAAYGYAATRNAQVTYQPDVVIVEGGPTIVRWVSSDGLTWAIDPNAKGVSDLKVGSVMFATSRAVGRVVTLADANGSKLVTLAPIDLTELVSDADLHLDQQIDFNSLAYQVVPDLPGAVQAPDASGAPAGSPAGSPAADVPTGSGVVQLPPIRLVASTPQPSLPPLQTEGCPELQIGSWAVKACSEPGKFSLGFDHSIAGGSHDDTSTGLKVGAMITFNHADKLQIVADQSIQGSETKSFGATIRGLTGYDVTLNGGAANGAKDNGKVTMEIPVELEYPIPPSPGTLGLPLNTIIEFKFSVETAFSGNNSTLSAVGKYELSGPLGFVAGQVQAPTFGVKQSMLQSLSGIAVGPSGIVLAGKIKWQVGLGIPGSVAGPYGTFTVSFGVTRGSALGSPLEDCRGVTIAMFIGAGIGFQTDIGALSRLLGDKVKFKLESEVKDNIYNRTTTVPASKACVTG